MLIVELKKRLMVIMLNMLTLFIVLILNRDKLMYVLNELMGGKLVEVSIVDTFKVIIELICILVLILSLPLILVEIYMFTCQGLYKKEQRQVRRIMILNVILWFIGLFTFKILFVNIRDMLFTFKNVGIEEIESIDSVLSNYKLIIKVLIMLLFIYQIPLIIQICVYVKLVNGLQLLNNRKYFILGIILLISIVNGVEIWSNVMLMLGFILIYEGLSIKERIRELKRKCHN